MIRTNNDFPVFGWIDFSSEHREKVKTVIDLLAISDVVDELGIGTIRDCFSDTLFPGISTIQTRAKYFLTLPRLLREYQALKPHIRRKHPLADWLNDQENQCMKCLFTNHRTDPQKGIIGVDFAEKLGEVQRKPSSVYWNGLRLFGLVKTKRSLAEFLRKFANPDAPLLDLIEGTDDTKGDDRDAIDVTSPVVAPPTKDEEWKEHLTLHLSFDEATFLARQIKQECLPVCSARYSWTTGYGRNLWTIPRTGNLTNFAIRLPLSLIWPSRYGRRFTMPGTSGDC